MSLKQLDFLSSKEGGNAFAVILTGIMNSLYKTKEIVDTPDDFDQFIKNELGKFPEFMTMANQPILEAAFKDYFMSQDMAIQLTPILFQVARQVFGLENYTFIKMLSAVMYAAININNSLVNHVTSKDEALSKRDLIRLLVFLYEINQVAIRNFELAKGEAKLQ